MTDVLLIRHGQSQSNAGLPTQFSEQVDLTDGGREQAKEVANYIFKASLIPDLIVTSPYQRTDQTAFPLRYYLLQEYPLEAPKEEWPVQEFTYLSSWHNIASTVTDRRHDVDSYWHKADPISVDGPDAESFKQFIDRVRKFKSHLESTEHSTIAVFSHEQFITAFLWFLQRGEVTPTPEEMRDYRAYLLANPIPNGGIMKAKFRKGNGEWTFERIITEHLNRLANVPVPALAGLGD